MQATVSGWDEQRRSAHVVLDDGRELPVAGGAVDEAGLVRLARGQRLTVELAHSAASDASGAGALVVERIRLLG